METPPPTNTIVAFFTFILRDAFGLLVFFSYIYTYIYILWVVLSSVS